MKTNKDYTIIVKVMRRLAFMILVSAASSHCSSQKDPGIPSRGVACHVYQFPLNGDSVASFGYHAYSDFDFLAPNSISTDGKYCFLTDPFFNRIKRISLETGELISSAALPDSLARVNDCAIVDDHVQVATSNGHVVFLDYALERLSVYKVSRAVGQIIRTGEGYGTVYFPSDDFKTVTIAPNGDVAESLNQRHTSWHTVHGRYLLKTPDSIQTEFYKVSKDAINYVRSPYGGPNLDYFKSYVVHFNVHDSLLNVNVCRVQR